MSREKKQTNRVIDSEKESVESRKLFLKAVLAEYTKLNEDMNQHGRNIIYIFSVMIGGLTTLIGVFGVIGSLSLLLTPIFLSFCLVGVFAEYYTSCFNAKYIKEEIEDRKLHELFPNGSPIQWEGRYQSQHQSYNFAFVFGVFALAFLIDLGCLIAVYSVFWNDVYSNLVYIFIYTLGWIMFAYSSIWASFILYTLRSFQKTQ